MVPTIERPIKLLSNWFSLEEVPYEKVDCFSSKARRERVSINDTKNTIWFHIYFADKYNIGNYKALYSISKEDESSFKQVIYQLTILHGDFGMYDQISLGTVTYTVDRASGLIVISHEGIRGIRGKLN